MGVIIGGGGSGGRGTSDYEKLKNKPSINGQELKGNIELSGNITPEQMAAINQAATVVDDVHNLSAKVVRLDGVDEQPINISNIPRTNGFINPGTGKYYAPSNGLYDHVVVSVTSSQYFVRCSNLRNIAYAFLVDRGTIVSGQSPVYCEGYNNAVQLNVEPSSAGILLDIPRDCNYLYLTTQTSGNIVELEVSVPAVVGEVEKVSNRVSYLEANVGMTYLPFVEHPYYYHFNPEGFVNGIPSQSTEDNAIAKRLGFKIVEANIHQTATAGKYIVTHGSAGKFGYIFAEPYKSTLISTMTYDDIVANVKYNSVRACYNHHVSTMDEFFRSCAQLGLGVYLRSNDSEIVNAARSYLPDNLIIIDGKAGIRSELKFGGVMTTYLPGDNFAQMCDSDYLRNHVNERGGAPYHIVMNGGAVDYMESAGTLNTIVPMLRKEGIYIGVCYSTPVQAEKLVAVGGCGIAANVYMCNPMCESANFGTWSSLDTSGWTIPPGITYDGGRLVNNTSAPITIVTPSTGVLALAKGQVEARIKGDVAFVFGNETNIDRQSYTNYNDDRLIVMCECGFSKDMNVNITIGANSSVEFFSYLVSRC